ncbi:hypothetical protein ACFL1H_01320 [Nanoarchaeota archaeon]
MNNEEGIEEKLNWKSLIDVDWPDHGKITRKDVEESLKFRYRVGGGDVRYMMGKVITEDELIKYKAKAFSKPLP